MKPTAKYPYYMTGFTLLEGILVLALVGLFTAAAIPGIMRMYNLHNVNGTADQLGADIRYAEQLAITKTNPYYIQIYYTTDNPASPETTNSYKVYSVLSGATTVDKRVVLENKGYLISSDFTGGLIKFETNGSTTPLNDGRILIGQSNPTTGGHFFAVTVKYSTGKVKIFQDVWPTTW